LSYLAYLYGEPLLNYSSLGYSSSDSSPLFFGGLNLFLGGRGFFRPRFPRTGESLFPEVSVDIALPCDDFPSAFYLAAYSASHLAFSSMAF